MRARPFLVWPLAVAAFLVGCSGGGEPGSGVATMGSTPNPSQAPCATQVAITLVNEGVNAAIRGVTLDLTGVEIRTAHGPWLALPMNGLAKRLDLQQDLPAPLIEAGELEPGTYEDLRFRLGDRHAFTAADGSSHGLTAPPELVCPHAELRIRKGALTRLAVFVHATQAIRETHPGSGQFALQAHGLHCRLIEATGFISGRLATEGTGAPVAGALVTAQSLLAGSQSAKVLRTTTSSADGSYTLNLLPLGQDYRVVVQPGPDGPMHEVAVSDALHLGAGAPPSASRDFLLRPLPAGHWGRVRITSFPGRDPGHLLDEINVRQVLHPEAGAPPWHLVLARWRVTGPGPYELGPLPPGHCVVGFRQETRMATMGTSDQAERHSRTVEIKPGATAMLP